MSSITRTPARRDIDGLAIIGRTPHDLRGIRHGEGEEGSTPAAEPAARPAPASTAAPAAPAASEPAAPAWDGKIESLHPDAQKIITDLRKEAGDNRVKATSADSKLQAVLKAAGIATNEEDPIEVAATSRAERDAAKRELAVYKSAATAGADPSKLLDRASFLTSIQGIDPTDGPALLAAINAAVTADNTLKAARAAGASAVETSGGTGEIGQITEAQLAQMTPEQINDALEKGQLKHLLG